MKPFNLFFALILNMGISVNAHSNEEVKLICNMNLVDTHSTGNQRKQHITDVIEIYSSATGYLSIIPQGENLFPVDIKGAIKSHVIRELNLSNANKWHLEQTSRWSSGSTTITRYVIDRNTGRISYFHDVNDGNKVFNGTGSCKAVTKDKKQF